MHAWFKKAVLIKVGSKEFEFAMIADKWLKLIMMIQMKLVLILRGGIKFTQVVLIKI